MCASYGTRWRAHEDRSLRATPRRPLRSLYIEERATRARALGCHCSWFLSRFASIETCFVSAGVLLSSLAIDSTLVCLIPASATPLARRVPFYIANKNIYIYIYM